MLQGLEAANGLIELHAGANGNYSYRDGCIYFPINCVLVAEYPSSDSTAIFMRFFGARFFVGVRARTVLATIDFEVRLIRGGHALKINLDRFWSIVTDCTQFLQLTAQTTSAFAELVLLNHACLATHDATQRLMRLLLEARDAYPDDVGITLTQAQLGQFVGIRRETVTDILKQFAQPQENRILPYFQNTQFTPCRIEMIYWIVQRTFPTQNALMAFFKFLKELKYK